MKPREFKLYCTHVVCENAVVVLEFVTVLVDAAGRTFFRHDSCGTLLRRREVKK